ncbi:MAG: MarR family winged helix-turn-helix transcriptional regulator [Oligosphaeraceae bacterium]
MSDREPTGEELLSLLSISFNIMEFCQKRTPELEKHLPTAVQIRAMKFMEQLSPGKVSLKEIGALLNLSQGAASKLVDRMVRLGMLQREWDEKDRRTIRITLAPRGKEISEYHQERTRLLLQDLLKGMDQEEIRSFLKVAGALNRKLWQGIRKRATPNPPEK